MVLLVLFPNSVCVDYFEIDGKDPLHYHRIGGVIVGVLSSSAVDRGFEPRQVKPKSKDGLARSQNRVSEWSDMSTCGPLFR